MPVSKQHLARRQVLARRGTHGQRNQRIRELGAYKLRLFIQGGALLALVESGFLRTEQARAVPDNEIF